MQGVRGNRPDPSRRVFDLSTSYERTIVRLWRDAASAGRSGAAYLVEVEPGRWQETSWDEAARAVEELAFTREHPGALDAAAAAVDEEDIYTYIYTSGTTGPPKGCMIRHRNYYAMTSSIERIEDLWLGEDVMLLYLPLAHNFRRLMS